MPNWKCRRALCYFAAALGVLAANAGCGSRKPESTPAGVTMTPEHLQDEVDKINADPSLDAGQKQIRIRMLRSHVTVAADAGGEK